MLLLHSKRLRSADVLSLLEHSASQCTAAHLLSASCQGCQHELVVALELADAGEVPALVLGVARVPELALGAQACIWKQGTDMLGRKRTHGWRMTLALARLRHMKEEGHDGASHATSNGIFLEVYIKEYTVGWRNIWLIQFWRNIWLIQ